MRIDLRPELLPPDLDAGLVAHLAELASQIDSAAPESGADQLAEFNRLADVQLHIDDFFEIFEVEDYDEWVVRVLRKRAVASELSLTHPEMLEVVHRIKDCDDDFEWYWWIFEAGCRHPSGLALIHTPNHVPEFPWGHEPTAEEIADLALRGPV